MKKGLMISSALLLSVTFVSAIFAQRPQDIQAQRIAKARGSTFWGEVVSYDAGAKLMVVRIARGEITLNLNYSTFQGWYTAAEDVPPGTKVTGKYHEVDSLNYAFLIRTFPDNKTAVKNPAENLPAASPENIPASIPTE